MAIPSSQSLRSESEMATKRPVMSADLFRAAIKGNSDVLIRRLRLVPEELKEMQVIGPMPPYRSLMPRTTHPMMVRNIMPEILRSSSFSPAFPSLQVTIQDSSPEEISTENLTVQSELQSATRFGDTVLHILVTEWHNELALKVFQRDISLLKAQNKMLETPLHYAAKVGNDKVIHNLIESDRVVVKDVLAKTNKNGDTAMHVAAKHGHRDIGRVLMNLDPEVACRVNDGMVSPLHMAIIEGHTVMVRTMLEVDPTLACTPFSDGMFPIHEAARMGNLNLIKHFIEEYPDDVELRDPRGRNLFHIAAEEGQRCIFWQLFQDTGVREMIERMNNAMDYEGNTPLHIAAMKGHRYTMRSIWEMRMNNIIAETVRNNEGLTPYEVSRRQQSQTKKESTTIDSRILAYQRTNGKKFSEEWFKDVMRPLSLENKWERTQVIGLGSVLITTVTFAAAFTIPGGYNQDYGTPVLGRRYMFWAFILANALSFMQGFVSLFALLINALPGIPVDTFLLATIFFLLAATTMVVTFGLGLYVTLAPVCLPIAIILLVITLFIIPPALLISGFMKERHFRFITNFLWDPRGILAIYAVSLLFIFCVSLLSL